MSTATPPKHGAHTSATRAGSPPRVDEDDRAMQIAAAQLRLVTDRRLGKPTPEWVKELAAERPPHSA
jgi:hypothetical protein